MSRDNKKSRPWAKIGLLPGNLWRRIKRIPKWVRRWSAVLAVVVAVAVPVSLQCAEREPTSELAFVNVQGPIAGEEAAFMYQLASVTAVGWDDQGRLDISGLEPFNLGLLSVKHLPHLPVRMTVANRGREPTTVKAVSIIIYTEPFELHAWYWPSVDGQDWLLGAGESLEITANLAFTELVEAGKTPKAPAHPPLPGAEHAVVAQLRLTDTKNEERVCTVECTAAVPPDAPELRELYWIPDTAEEKSSFHSEVTFPSSWVEAGGNPWLAGAYDALGNKYEAAGRYDDAINAYSAAIRLIQAGSTTLYDSSCLSTSLHGRAFSRNSLGRTDKAIEDYKLALAIDPEDEVLYRDLAFTYMKKSFETQDPTGAQAWMEKAKSVLEESIKRGHEDWQTFQALGVVCVNSGQCPDAVDALTEAIRLNPTDENNYVYRAAAYIGLGRSDLAEDDYSTAFHLGWSPEDEEESVDGEHRFTFPVYPSSWQFE